MEETKKVIVMDNSVPSLSEIMGGTTGTSSSTANVGCMVRGCTKKAAYGTTQIHLCEDHLHLAFKTTTYKRPAPKVGRNEKCTCGSGSKFKKCCGK